MHVKSPTAKSSAWKKQLTQKTLGAFGATKMVRTMSGKVVEEKIPDTIPDVQPVALPCPWCNRTFANTKALGSHKSHAHPAAFAAAGASELPCGPIPLDVVNKVMLMIGQLEHDVGKWCGAKKLNENTGMWVDFDGDKQQLRKKGGASMRSRKPIWMIKKAILLRDLLAKKTEVTDPQYSAAQAFDISTSSMSRYMHPDKRNEIMAACKNRALSRRVQAKRTTKDKFERATEKTLKEFRAHRQV